MGLEPSATEIKSDPIFQVASGFMAAKFLFVAKAVGLFEKLAKGRITTEELAERSRVPRRTMRIFRCPGRFRLSNLIIAETAHS